MRHSQAIIAEWQLEYIGLRPHSVLGYQMPKEFLERFLTADFNRGTDLIG
jgi:transposase InsO family protein